jgi:hypothetical protein
MVFLSSFKRSRGASFDGFDDPKTLTQDSVKRETALHLEPPSSYLQQSKVENTHSYCAVSLWYNTPGSSPHVYSKPIIQQGFHPVSSNYRTVRSSSAPIITDYPHDHINGVVGPVWPDRSPFSLA